MIKSYTYVILLSSHRFQLTICSFQGINQADADDASRDRIYGCRVLYSLNDYIGFFSPEISYKTNVKKNKKTKNIWYCY